MGRRSLRPAGSNLHTTVMFLSLSLVSTSVGAEGTLEAGSELVPPKLNWNPGPEYADEVRMFQVSVPL